MAFFTSDLHENIPAESQPSNLDCKLNDRFLKDVVEIGCDEPRRASSRYSTAEGLLDFLKHCRHRCESVLQGNDFQVRREGIHPSRGRKKLAKFYD